MRVALLITLALLLPACSSTEERESSAPLETVFASLGLPPGEAIVLVYDPADCFSCFGALSEWLRWSRSHRARFRLVFTRPATPQEDRRLVRLRVRPDVVLREGTLPPGVPTPAEYLLRDGRQVHSSRLVAARPATPLLRYVLDSLSVLPARDPSPSPPAKETP